MKNSLVKMTMVILTVVVLLLSWSVPITAAEPRSAQVYSSTIQVAPLSNAEIQYLKFLREEEKLARDVYLQLFNTWQLTIFQNIASSEQKHMDAIKKLLDRYNVTDPALLQDQFTEQSGLQQLYSDLILKGSQSKIDALEVGVIIEEKDIEDLHAAIAVTTHSDIKTVYNNLLSGSLNHLAAFNSHFE